MIISFNEYSKLESKQLYKKYNLKKEIWEFDNIYRGAEFYSLQDPDNEYFKEPYIKSDHWYNLMFKNNGRGLTKEELAEMKHLSDDLRHEDI
jgi:hypothetical protein